MAVYFCGASVGSTTSRMVGNSTQHSVSGLRFDNFTVDGTHVGSLAALGAATNGFVYNVSFLH
jgi:hypothetical protein|eukprot:COSAG03_NODE_544_length_7025_cov_8.435894_8_plen_63_part_00